MEKMLDGKVWIVTDAGREIAKSTGVSFAKAGGHSAGRILG